MNQLKLGVILSFVLLFLTNGISLLFTPYMIGKLGQAEYGLYILIGSLMGFLELLTFGMGGTLVRYIARYRATGEKEKEENLLAMALIVYGVISVLIFLAGSILWIYLPDIFPKLTSEELGKGKVMLALLVASMIITVPGSIFTTVQTAYEHFVFTRARAIIVGIIRVMAMVALLFFGYKAIAIVVVGVVLNILNLLLDMGYAFRVLRTRIRLYHFDKVLLNKIFKFSFWIFLSMIMDQLYWRFGQTVLGMTTGTTAVAVFSVGITMATFFMSFSSAISGVFVPRAAIMDTQNADGETMTSMMIRIGRYQALVMGLPLTGFLCLGQLFLLNWLGKDYLGAWPITLLLVVPLFLPLIQNFGIAILQAKNKHSVRSLMYIIIAVINVVIGYFLSLKYGSIGMAIGTSLSLIMGQGIAINLYYHYRIGLNIPRFFKEVAKGFIPSLLLSCLIGYFMVTYLPLSTWHGFFYKAVLLSVFYAGIMWFIGMNDDEKSTLLRLFQHIPYIGAWVGQR